MRPIGDRLLNIAAAIWVGNTLFDLGYRALLNSPKYYTYWTLSAPLIFLVYFVILIRLQSINIRWQFEKQDWFFVSIAIGLVSLRGVIIIPAQNIGEFYVNTLELCSLGFSLFFIPFIYSRFYKGYWKIPGANTEVQKTVEAENKDE